MASPIFNNQYAIFNPGYIAQKDLGGKDGWCQSPEFARIGLSSIMLAGEGGGVKVKEFGQIRQYVRGIP